MTLSNTLKTALRAITANALRSMLTTLGIIIGVASVIAMLALGNGAKAAVAANFRFLGSDTIQVRMLQKEEQGEFVPVGKILSYDDGLRMAAEVDLVQRVDMFVGGTGKVRYNRNVVDVNVSGVTAHALESMLNSKEVQPLQRPTDRPLTPDVFMGRGRFFTPAEVLAGADICVLGHKTALDLFGGDEPLDEVVIINRRRCIVVGVLAELEVVDPNQRNRLRPNEAFYMPVSSTVRQLYEEEPSLILTARVKDESQMGQAKAQIRNYLRRKHSLEANRKGEYEDDFELITRNDILGAQQEAARTFSLLLAGMAAVSLLVGGIGIMNVMLVSVTERTREIGVRLAVGAQATDIINQFLLEAVLISAGGGLLGIAVGILSIPLAASLNRGQALLDPNSIPLAFGVALLVGVLFGLYPAIRAARLDPIEALRYE